MSDRRTKTLAASAVLSLCMFAGPAATAAAPPGYVDASAYGWNASDATTALQNAINNSGGLNVYVPKMASDWIIGPVTLRSNQTVLFQSGVVVTAKAGAFPSDTAPHRDLSLLTAPLDATNVTLSGYGATLRMHPDEYDYTLSATHHAVRIWRGSHITVEGLTIQDTGGDGIYVGGGSSASDQNQYSSNVLIKDVHLNRAYRNGISLISADGVTIDNAVISNTNGAAPRPRLGIDLEPNYTGQRLRNITIQNSIFNGNLGGGIGFSPEGTDSSQVQNVVIKNVTVYDNGDTSVTPNKGDGIGLNHIALPGVSIKDSLFVDNVLYGVRGTSNNVSPPYATVDYSGFWGNGSGSTAYSVTAGPHNQTGVNPLFYSTDASSPYFLYLDPNISNLISQGSSTGSYMGARPVFVPEPMTMGLWAAAAAVLLGGRRRKVRGS